MISFEKRSSSADNNLGTLDGVSVTMDQPSEDDLKATFCDSVVLWSDCLKQATKGWRYLLQIPLASKFLFLPDYFHFIKPYMELEASTMKKNRRGRAFLLFILPSSGLLTSHTGLAWSGAHVCITPNQLQHTSLSINDLLVLFKQKYLIKENFTRVMC